MKINKFTSIVASLMLAGAFTSVSACGMDVDIHPTSCPNPMNLKSGGLVPAAIVGREGKGVERINPNHENGIQMVGHNFAGERVVVKAVKWDFEDVVTPFSKDNLNCENEDEFNEYTCTEQGPDLIEDLTLKFPMQGVWKDGTYLPGVADILEGYAKDAVVCIGIEAWEKPEANGYVRWVHGKDVVRVQQVAKVAK